MRTLAALGAVALATLLAAGWLGAMHPALDSVGHFRLHLVAVALALALVLAVVRARRSLALLLATAAASLALTWPALPGLAPPAKGHASPDLVVAQQNLLYLNATPEDAVHALAGAEADVLLLQEVSERNRAVLRVLADRFPYRAVCPFRRFRSIAILSRHPFQGEPRCGGDAGVASARIGIAGRSIAVASLHARWPWPYPQWRHVDEINAHLAAIPPPLVLGGDFNASPWSAFVRRLSDAANARPVPGLRFTFNLRTLQRGDSRVGGLPLDHVLHTADLVPTGVQLLPHAGSDHLGTRVAFAFASP